MKGVGMSTLMTLPFRWIKKLSLTASMALSTGKERKQRKSGYRFKVPERWAVMLILEFATSVRT